jgi:hypothetical protein
LGGGFGRRLFRNVVFGRGDVVRDRHRRWMVAGMGGSHGRRKQKHDHDGRRSHNVRKSQLHSHAFTYHGSAILTRFIRGVSKSRMFIPAGGNLQKFLAKSSLLQSAIGLGLKSAVAVNFDFLNFQAATNARVIRSVPR